MTTYETPELFEIGDVQTLTLGRRLGLWSDGVPGYFTFVAITDDEDDPEAP